MEKEKKSGHGGAREGAGRRKGTTDRVTIAGLLEAVQNKANGKCYMEQLAEDFQAARVAKDTNLTMKYHNLILNKVAATLTNLEVTDSTEAVANKEAAFLKAIDLIQTVAKSK
jgi:hypothetical protein